MEVSGLYPLPWWGLETSAAYQNLPGVEFAENLAYSRAQIESLARPLNASTVTIPIVPPGTLYGDRLSQLDVRLWKNSGLRASVSR